MSMMRSQKKDDQEQRYTCGTCQIASVNIKMNMLKIDTQRD